MKTLLLPLLVCTASLLPVAQSHAVESASPSFGGFTPGLKFTFKVTKAECTKLEKFVSTKSTIPKGVPKFRKNQKVSFTIGKQGQLTGPGILFTYQSASQPSNSYVHRAASNTNEDEITIYKDSLGKPVAAGVTVYKEIRSNGFLSIPVVYTVRYQMDK